MRPLFLLLLAP